MMRNLVIKITQLVICIRVVQLRRTGTSERTIHGCRCASHVIIFPLASQPNATETPDYLDSRPAFSTISCSAQVHFVGCFYSWLTSILYSGL
jgi:hypothetical protein